MDRTDSEIRALEERLLAPEVRASRDALEGLIAEDFVEFGSSGRVYTKAEIIPAVLANPMVTAAIQDFRTLTLAPDAVLATYRLGDSLRSSVWRRDGSGWRIVFHQGTRTSDSP